MKISSPSAGGNVNVTTQGSLGTICVSGTISAYGPNVASVIVRVRVVNGQHPGVQSPQPSGAMDRDASPTGTYFLAVNVPFAGWSGSPVDLNIFAWEIYSGGSGSVADSQAIVCSGVTSGGSDCCPSGATVLVNQLASTTELEITIPNGPHAGVHRATVVSSLSWRMSIGGVIYEICCPSPASLAIVGPDSITPCLSFESNPFSATFPGDIFQASGEIVVTGP